MSIINRMKSKTRKAIDKAFTMKADYDARQADKTRKSVKLASQTKHIKPDVSTGFGRDVMNARDDVMAYKQKVKRKKK